jgi:hypothetical protein
VTLHDPAWDTASPAYCPFTRDGVCCTFPPCPSNDRRKCLDDDQEQTP